MRRFLKKKRGQVLIAAITAMFVLFIFSMAVVQYGNWIYQKIHMQNIADSGAMEGGLWYARALNMVSISNKLLIVSSLAALIAAVLSLGSLAPEAEKTMEGIIEVQDFFAGTGDFKDVQVFPLINAGAVMINGWRNGEVLSLPLFNVETFSKRKAMPSYNLKRRTLADFLFPDSESATFYYVEQATGDVKVVPTIEVGINKAGKIYHKPDGKFLASKGKLCDDEEWPLYIQWVVDLLKALPEDAMKEAKKAAGEIPLDIAEDGPHTVLVVSAKWDFDKTERFSFIKDREGKEIKPMALIGTAMSRIDGGSMCFWNLNGANYTPHLDHIFIPKINTGSAAGSGDALGKMGKYAGDSMNSVSAGDYDRIFELLNKANEFIGNYVLLH